MLTLLFAPRSTRADVSKRARGFESFDAARGDHADGSRRARPDDERRHTHAAQRRRAHG